MKAILDQAGEYLDVPRKAAILSAFSARVEDVRALAKAHHPEDDLSQDVRQDRAEDYTAFS